MDETYNVIIKRKNLLEEDHEKNEKNMIRIKVFDKEGNLIDKNNIFCVQIVFSRDGALGFGKELIRSVFKENFNSNCHHHLVPVYNGNANQNLGVCLTNDSPELVVAFEELGSIVDEIERSK